MKAIGIVWEDAIASISNWMFQQVKQVMDCSWEEFIQWCCDAQHHNQSLEDVVKIILRKSIEHFQNKDNSKKKNSIYDMIQGIGWNTNGLNDILHFLRQHETNYQIFILVHFGWNAKLSSLLKSEWLPLLTSIKIEWIVSHLGKQWLPQLVISSHPMLQQQFEKSCDFLIRPILVQQNHQLMIQCMDCISKTSVTVNNWKEWKSFLKIDSSIESFPWFIHGSEDSLDKDVIYCFPQLPSNKDYLAFTNGAKEDRNIFTMDAQLHVVSACFRSPIDELNNGLVDTYALHSQQYPLEITRKVKRVILVKYVSTVTSILVRFRRTILREDILPALYSKDFLVRKQILSQLDFTKLNEEFCNQLEEGIESIKFAAFRLTQSIALCHGKEIYTKRAAANYLKCMEPLLYRKTSKETMIEHLQCITKYRDVFVSLFEGIQVQRRGPIHMFVYESKQQQQQQSQSIIPLLSQANGILINIFDDSLIYYGLDVPLKETTQATDWPEDTIAKQQTTNANQFFVYLIPETLLSKGTEEEKDLSKQFIVVRKNVPFRFVVSQVNCISDTMDNKIVKLKKYIESGIDKQLLSLLNELEWSKFYFVFLCTAKENDQFSFELFCKRNNKTFLLE